MHFVKVLIVPLFCISLTAAAQQGTTKVEGTLVLPKELASFGKGAVEIRLYKFDPRIADKAADLVDKLEIKDFRHTQGQETKKDFVLGEKGALEPKMTYYVTLFILDGDKRTHIGEDEKDLKAGPPRVLTGGNPNKVAFKVREVKKGK